MPDDREWGTADEDEEDVMAGERRIARADTALPDWYASDAAYRPIPIAWFAGALVLQCLLQPGLAIGALSLGFSRWFAIGLCFLATVSIAQLTWVRGMANAPLGWRVATAMMLTFFFAIATLGLLG